MKTALACPLVLICLGCYRGMEDMKTGTGQKATPPIQQTAPGKEDQRAEHRATQSVAKAKPAPPLSTSPSHTGGRKMSSAIKVSGDSTEEMKAVATRTSELLDAAPDDPTGKRSRWFGPLKTWHKQLDRAIQTGA